MLVVGVTEEDMTKGENSKKFENPIIEKLDSVSGGLLSEACIKEEFTGKAGQSIVVSVPGLGPKQVSLIGLEKATGSSTSVLCVFGESVASVARASQANTVGIALASSESLTSQPKLATASAIAKGIFLGTHEVNRFISDSKKLYLKSVDFFGLGNGPELEKKLKYTEYVCSGVILAKELVNAHANALTLWILEEAEKIAAAYSDCIALHIPSVAAASTNPPQFFNLHYKPPSGSVKAKLALVAFDSGACNIKTGPGSTELKKFGIGGSAAVLGAAKALGQIKPYGVEVHCIVAAGENMIRGTGMRPGFVSTGASNGKTIEINTDSEGRVTLADALGYACSQGAGKIVSLETADGACVATLGPLVAG